ncbi:hypothetical protein ACFMBG_11640 [Leisingera sp. D0M16]|uniref:hypothetical protein n=1 Tax=Leisingera coralii TaxID=3351347 RepID=UPI003B80DE02
MPGPERPNSSRLPVTLRPCGILVPSDLEKAIPETIDAPFHLAADVRGAHNLLTLDMALVLTSTMLADSSKAINELGYTPSSLEKMLRDEIEWLAENGCLGKRTTWVWN